MKNEAVTTEPTIVCAYCQSPQGFRRSAPMLSRTIFPPSSTLCPTGCCMKASVATMK